MAGKETLFFLAAKSSPKNATVSAWPHAGAAGFRSRPENGHISRESKSWTFRGAQGSAQLSLEALL